MQPVTITNHFDWNNSLLPVVKKNKTKLSRKKPKTNVFKYAKLGLLLGYGIEQRYRVYYWPMLNVKSLELLTKKK